MRNPRFPITAEVRALGRAFHTDDGITREGWTITLALDEYTHLRVFVSNEALEEERTVADPRRPKSAAIQTIRRRPALMAGDTVELELSLPVLDDI